MPTHTTCRQLAADRLAGLNGPQVAAVSHLDGPLLVVAGPGSGKTRVLTYRIAALIDVGVSPREILAVTFTNKAAAEMRERLERLLPDLPRREVERMWVSTFHAACAKLLRFDGERVGVPPGFTIADVGIARRVLRTVVEQLGFDVDDEVLKHAAGTISRAKNALVSPEQMAGAADLNFRSWAETADRYQDELARQQLLDFDDLLVGAVELLRDPEANAAWTDRFRYLLVDEFQDTNAAQYELVRLLSGASGQVCAVGDRQQAIYGWRGAQPALMRRFTEEFAPTVITLEQNYRSTRHIVEVSAALVAPLDDGTVAHAQLWTDNDLGAPVEQVRCEDDRDEARWVVGEIAASGVPFDEHAILFRTNAQTNLFEQELASRGISYRLVGATRFFDRAEVRDALAWLQLVENPANLEAFRRAVGRPKRGVGDKSLAHILTLAREADLSPLQWLSHTPTDQLPARLRHPATTFLAAVTAVTAAVTTGGPSSVVRAVLDDVGLLDSFRSSTDPRAEERVENLAELEAAATRFEQDRPGATVGEFLEHVALATAADDDGEGGVWLITAHAAKGREFPRVWVVGVEDGYFPHSRAKEAQWQRDEERRLLFVAASRAMERLTLTVSGRRMLFGTVVDRTASPFLSDIADLVERRFTPAIQRAERGFQGRRAPGIPPTFTGGRRPPARKPAVDVALFAVGRRVEHPRFGQGAVTGVAGDRVTVSFDDGVQRVLSATYAPLVTLGS